MFPNTSQMGFQPSTLIGTQSIEQTRQQMVSSAYLLSMFQPGTIQTANLGTISANALGSSTVTSQLTVGTTDTAGGTTIDGVNNRIIINDGTNPRILIGYLQGAF